VNLLYAAPTYGPTADPMFDKNHRVALMYAANHGVRWVGDCSPDREGWSTARNHVVKSAIEAAEQDPIDGVFWVDDDIVMPQETISRISGYDLDFVSGLYFQRSAPFWPLFAIFNKKINAFEWPAIYPENVLAPCDGVGFGCVYTSIKLLRAVSKLPECKEDGPFGGDFGKKSYGEDFTFCLRAKKAGFQAYVDTSVKCEHHIGPEFSNEELYRRVGGALAVKMYASSNAG
jgi:hypothetical protein